MSGHVRDLRAVVCVCVCARARFPAIHCPGSFFAGGRYLAMFAAVALSRAQNWSPCSLFGPESALLGIHTVRFRVCGLWYGFRVKEGSSEALSLIRSFVPIPPYLRCSGRWLGLGLWVRERKLCRRLGHSGCEKSVVPLLMGETREGSG